MVSAKKSGGMGHRSRLLDHGEKVPVDLALREILRMSLAALKEAGEQWNDQAKQDLVSTLFIQAAHDGAIQWRLPGGFQC